MKVHHRKQENGASRKTGFSYITLRYITLRFLSFLDVVVGFYGFGYVLEVFVGLFLGQEGLRNNSEACGFGLS